MSAPNLQQLFKEGKISNKTLDRVQIAKSYIEKKYRLKKIQEEEKKRDWDNFHKKMDDLNLSSKEKDIIKKDVIKKEAEFLRLTRKKISIREFEPLAIIGKGAFGEVRVCREIATGEIVAIKKMRKEDMYQKNQIMHVRTEKEILTTANSPWVVNLRYSFQDDFFLYLVMDFLPGGDLMSLLMKKDILTEEEARFYTAEMILAIETVHQLNSIHRDLKPDNVLIDKDGHIKLSDFGLSKLSDHSFFPMSTELKEKEKQESVNDNITNAIPSGNSNLKTVIKKEDVKSRKKNRLIAFSTVGTPDYIAPEVFSQHGYGQEVDWWSVGVILFEMLVGYPPFFSENPSDTCQKIVNWKKYFTIPLDANLSLEADNLIRRLVTVPEARLGINGAEEIKKHPFFKNVDWENIRKTKAPFIPDLSCEWDTKYFDTFAEQEPFYPKEKKSRKGRKELAFMDYTWKNEDNYRRGMLHAIEVLEAVKISTAGDEKVNIIADNDHLQTEEDTKEDGSGNGTNNLTSNSSTNNIKTNFTNTTTTTKPNVNVININTSGLQQRTSKSPELKNSQPTNQPDNTGDKIKQKNTSTTGKGLNIIPIKSLHNNGNVNEKISPKGSGKKINIANLTGNISPRSGFGNKPQTTKNANDNRIHFDMKTNYKSPSPNRGTNSTSTKYLKKSPELKK